VDNDLGGKAVFRASPTGADGKVYCENANGDVWVVSAEDGKVLSQLALEGKGARGSVVVGDRFVLVRAGETLYAFEQSNKTQIVYSAMNACL